MVSSRYASLFLFLFCAIANGNERADHAFVNVLVALVFIIPGYFHNVYKFRALLDVHKACSARR